MEELTMIEQKSVEWYRQRIGKFTSSRLSDLLIENKQKNGFGEKAISYIYEVAAERSLSNQFLNGDGFEMYINRISMTSKPIRWGEEFEDMARECLSEKLECEIFKSEFLQVNDYFGDSADGYFIDKRGIEIPVEIKCPTPATHKRYCQIENENDLMCEKKEYYIQCQGHIIARNAPYCLFVSFDPMQKNKLHIINVSRNNSIIELINKKIDLANEVISILK